MAFTVSEQRAGLASNETLVDLDDGHCIAVAVEPSWLANGSGVAIRASARWVDSDGQTHTCPAGQHVELTFSHTADAASVERHGLAALSKEVLLLVLGEAPTLVDHDNEDGTTHSAPIIAFGDDVRLNASVRRAIAVVGAVGTINAGSVLG
ncbi:MAG: hypothetical protein E7773_10250 [Sphingomonas sp.]|uniref:hypothetical protein n=1 Tax=Sphingomonas sp. TaxID=28214 RepID=UPI001212D469|nr:hypothetical protein [Sphingomonas sp.]THD35719.1 MAG: hypothetical protein E7773_10250 [Sphingomonas sp.]